MTDIIKIIIIIVLSYLIGSIPTGVVISKRFFGFDIREKGSGNMGSTNVFRVLGFKWGIVVQVIDLLKGIIPVVIGGLIAQDIKFGNTIFNNIVIFKFVAGIVAVCGHIWTVFGGFHGGKGINTTLGMIIAIAPIDAGVALAMFLIVVIFSGYVSLGSMLGAISFPLSLLIRYNFFHVNIEGYNLLIYFAILLAVLLNFTHRANIKRLIKGTENKFDKLQLIKFKK